jgi:hypothetical protein
MKKLLIGLALLLVTSVASAGPTTTLLLNATTTGAGTGVNYSLFGGGVPIPNRWIQAVITGSTPTATVEIDGSNDNVNWVPLATITLPTGAGAFTDAVATTQTAKYLRGNIKAISGTGASVTLISSQ